MPKYFKIDTFNRIIDANINRSKEGLRVCEEITRFILSCRRLTSEFKRIRHKIDAVARKLPVDLAGLLKRRESLRDVGRNIYTGELERESIQDIFFANIQRAKESIRVLEEFAKLANKKGAVGFKQIRYAIYEIEKKAAKRILNLRNRG